MRLQWGGHVLASIACPDNEPEGRRGIIDRLGRHGMSVSVLPAQITSECPKLLWPWSDSRCVRIRLAHRVRCSRPAQWEIRTTFAGIDRERANVVLTVDREARYRAIECHLSQSRDNAVLLHRLAVQGDEELLLHRREGGSGRLTT